jgi:hypothetical protein
MAKLQGLSYSDRLAMAVESHKIAPGCHFCERCLMSFNVLNPHCTMYGDGTKGIAALCEDCWLELEPADRLPFYYRLWVAWHRLGEPYPLPSAWIEIEIAVRSEI